MAQEGYHELLQNLTAGFSKLLSGFEELSRRNADLERQAGSLYAQCEELIGRTLISPPISCPPDEPTYNGDRIVSTNGIVQLPCDGAFLCGSDNSTIRIKRGSRAWTVAVAHNKQCERRSRTQCEKYRLANTDSISSISNPKNDFDRPREDLKQEFTNHDVHGSLKCPFTSVIAAQMGSPAYVGLKDSRLKRPDSLPTLPKAKDEVSEDPIAAESHAADLSSPPVSAAGSASKCPIRFLDQHSPEEVAQYFEKHKHEIPRSHEVCVKRYQSNTESIRQLDAKYGTLVNMIQGLGMKHQPLLPTKEEEEAAAAAADLERKSIEKVQNWVKGDIECHNSNATFDQNNNQIGKEREGHFERPLREIRVGESPSRPWGISVPYAEGLALSTTSGFQPEEKNTHNESSQAHMYPEVPNTNELREKCPFNNLTPKEKPTTSPKQDDIPAKLSHTLNDHSGSTRRFLETPNTTQASIEEHSKLVFTGPVFIGYPADQISSLMRRFDGGTSASNNV